MRTICSWTALGVESQLQMSGSSADGSSRRQIARVAGAPSRRRGPAPRQFDGTFDAAVDHRRDLVGTTRRVGGIRGSLVSVVQHRGWPTKARVSDVDVACRAVGADDVGLTTH